MRLSVRPTRAPALRRALPLALAMLLGCASAWALPTVRKYPVGPWVTNDRGIFSVPAGQSIDWLVRVCNDTGSPLTAQVTDFIHSGDCQNHDFLTLVCPPVENAGGTLTACDDAGLGTIDLATILVPVNTCADVVVRTTVDLLTPRGLPGGVCNVAFYQTDSGTPDGSGQTSPPSGNSGCSCVEILNPLPTQLDFRLQALPEAPPLRAGDSASTLIYSLDATNLTPREARGRVLFAIPPELDFIEIVDCPPGAACSYFSGSVEIQNIVMPEAGGFSARVRVAPNCSSAVNRDICARAEFLPIENASAIIYSDDPGLPGQQATCVRALGSDLRISKTWRLESDADGNGLPSIGDRVRYLLQLWNAGDGAAHGVNVVDNLPLGLDAASVAVDARGVYDVSRRQGTWSLPDIGAGSVIDLWMDAAVTGISIAPNRARLTTDVSRDCSLAIVLSDDPSVGGSSDATSISGTPSADISVAKSWTYTDLDGDGAVSASEPVEWLVEITNHGAGAAMDARVDDALAACWQDLSGGVSIDPANGGVNASTARAVAVSSLGGADGLLPDETIRLRFTLLPLDVSACCNAATVSWAAGSRIAVSSNPGALAAAAGATCLAATESQVSLSKSVQLLDSNGNGLAEPGERLLYTLTARSQSGSVSGVTLVDELPAGFTLDAASVITVPPGMGLGLSPAPAGLNGSGRIEVLGLGLSVGGSASLSFEGEIDAAARGTLCNRASLVVDGQLAPFLSVDSLTGGASCIDIVILDPPTLGVSLAVLPADPTGCLLPGEDVELTLDYSVSLGAASARDLALELQVPVAVTVVDADGGTESPGLITWSLGDQVAGASGSFTVIMSLPCGPASTTSFSAVLAASNAANVNGGPVSITTSVPGLVGSVVLVHDDTNADGDLDSLELLTAKLTITEGLGCDAEVVVAAMDVGSALDIVSVNDGGVALGSQVEWQLPVVAAGGSTMVSVDLSLSATAPNCSLPILLGNVTWALAAPACLDPINISLADTPTPPGDCVSIDPVDLLREDAIASLQPIAPTLAGLLDALGVDDTCNVGTTTRISPTRTYSLGVAAALATGVVVTNDALIVGAGSPGQLTFYEVSHSCAVIRVCRTDADADPLNGRESVLVTSGVCP